MVAMKADRGKRLKELENENARLKKIVADQAVDIRHPKGGESGKLLSPARRRAAVEHVRRRLGVSERRACRVIAQPRSTQRYVGRKAAEGSPSGPNGWSRFPGRTPATATGGCGRC